MFRRFNQKWDDGRIYVLPLTEKEKKRASLINGGFVLAAAAVQILMGMVNQDSSRTAWVVYPYLVMFLPLMYAGMGAVTFAHASCRMSTRQYEEGQGRVRRCLLGVFVLNAAGILLEIVYLLLHGQQSINPPELLYIGLHVVQAGVIFAYSRFYDRTLAGAAVET